MSTYYPPPTPPPTHTPRQSWWKRGWGIAAIAVVALAIGSGIGASAGTTKTKTVAGPTVTATATTTAPAPPAGTVTLKPTVIKTIATHTHVVTHTYTPPPKPAITDGVYQIGSDIHAGTWRTTGGGDCYYAILNSTSTNDIADNNDFTGPQIVTLYSGKYFEIDGGCKWRHV